jgi:hypothetical protein
MTFVRNGVQFPLSSKYQAFFSPYEQCTLIMLGTLIDIADRTKLSRQKTAVDRVRTAYYETQNPAK